MGEPFRVLVCDDSMGFPTLVQTWLHLDGRFAVVGLARYGEQAKELVAEHQPDVIVLDLVLPDVPDATVLVADLRALHPPLGVLLVSSLHPEALENAAREAGADGYCTKGAPAAELTKRLYAVASAAGSTIQKRLP